MKTRPYELQIENQTLRRLPPGTILPEYELDLSGCTALEELPPMSVPVIVLRDCISLEKLPWHMSVVHLDLTGCANLREWPVSLSTYMGRLVLAGCANLPALPSTLREVAELDISGCASLRRLPSKLRIRRSIELADTTLEALPDDLGDAVVRWRGVEIPPEWALYPERIDVEMVLAEDNAERRRILIERMGYERFLADANPRVLDADEDPGGARALVRVELPDDEDLVCLSCQCPSTARRYMLRVPPHIESCHAAAAWIAGFDDPDRYDPIVET